MELLCFFCVFLYDWIDDGDGRFFGLWVNVSDVFFWVNFSGIVCYCLLIMVVGIVLDLFFIGYGLEDCVLIFLLVFCGNYYELEIMWIVGVI